MLLKGRYKSLGLAGLLAAMAMVVVASVGASSASALPSFFHCTKQAGGSFTESKCATAGEGEWEKTEVKANEEKAFTSTSGEKILFSSAGTIKCKKDKNSGHTWGPKHVWVTITFEECTGPLGVACTTSGHTSGTIVTNELEGWLYYIKEAAPKEVGIFFTARSGTAFATFVCGFVEVTVESAPKTQYEPGGSYASGACLAARVEPINIMQLTGALIVKTVEEGGVKKQAIKEVKYEGHTFQCELQVKKEPAQEQEVEPPGDVITWLEVMEVRA